MAESLAEPFERQSLDVSTFSDSDSPSNDSRKYHPLFSSDEGNVIIRSSDGTHCRLPSVVLRTASGFFRLMLTLPQGEGTAPLEDTIAIDEGEDVAERLFKMISGLSLATWESLDIVERVLLAAEKYDMPGAISTIRFGITRPMFLAHPFWLYAIAARFEWMEEAKMGSKLTLSSWIHDPSLEAILQKKIPPFTLSNSTISMDGGEMISELVSTLRNHLADGSRDHREAQEGTEQKHHVIATVTS
jgi:hypothetical protein